MMDVFDSDVWRGAELSEQRRSSVKDRVSTQIVRDQRRHRRHVVSLAGVAVAASVASVAAYTVVSAPSAEASWSAVPAPLHLTSADALVRQCLENLPARESARSSGAGPTVAVAERRAESRAALLDDVGRQIVCIDTPRSRTGGSTESPALVGAQLLSLAGDGGSTDQGSGSRYVYGRVADRVAAVSVTTTTGLRVTASVADGSYIAWWPAGSGPRRVVAMDESGRVLTSLTGAGSVEKAG